MVCVDKKATRVLEMGGNYPTSGSETLDGSPVRGVFGFDNLLSSAETLDVEPGRLAMGG